MFIPSAFIIGVAILLICVAIIGFNLILEVVAAKAAAKNYKLAYDNLDGHYRRRQAHHDSAVTGLMKDNEALLKERCTLRRQLAAKASPQWPHSIKPSL